MKVRIGKAKKIVEKFVLNNMKLIKSGDLKNHNPIYLHSSPGIGKSSIIKQVTKNLNIGFVDLRLASMEASDVCGIPYVSHAGLEEEVMKLSIPTWFPTQAKVDAEEIPEAGIVFLDELSNAPIAVQHAAYRIVLDREVQTGVKMADGWMIVAAGNLKTDKTGAKGVAPAMANRFATHIEVEANLDDFRGYAFENGIHKTVMGFLSFKPGNLFKFDSSKNDTAFATPRSWEAVSDILKMDLDDEQLQVCVDGCVGSGTATELLAFRKYYGKLPDFNEIMSGKNKTYKVPTKDVGVLFAITSSVMDCLIQNYQDEPKIKNLEKVMKQLPDDHLILIYKTIKSLENQDLIAAIYVNTMDTFERVQKFNDI